MYWTWPQLLSQASRDVVLKPGDVIGSGTVGGGCILELTPEAVGGWIKPGDLVALEIERLGVLENRVLAPNTSGDAPASDVLARSASERGGAVR
jgi:fumarylacetoacetate (FAA) hydrolase